MANKVTLSILICTINTGIIKVPSVLMPPRSDVNYVVSMQYTEEQVLQIIPEELTSRDDVTITTLEGRGLSRNRNNAIAHATGDICLIADDDNRYTSEHIDIILNAYKEYPEADIIHFQAETLKGKPLHPYPADFVSSVELTFRRNIDIMFDERFGLGSKRLCAGEEQVFMKDARTKGCNIMYVPKAIVQTRNCTTGTNFLHNTKMQITKGATFRYVYGTVNAIWRSIKEAGWYLVHKGANPFPIIYNMIRGVYLFK